MSPAGCEIDGAVFGALVAQAAGFWLSLRVNAPVRIGRGVPR